MLTDLFLRFSVPTGAPYDVRIRAASTTSLLIEWTVRFLFLCVVECLKTKALETFYRRGSWNMINLFSFGCHVIDRAYVRTYVRTSVRTRLQSVRVG